MREPRCRHCWVLIRFHSLATVRARCSHGVMFGEAMTEEEYDLWEEMVAEDMDRQLREAERVQYLLRQERVLES